MLKEVTGSQWNGRGEEGRGGEGRGEEMGRGGGRVHQPPLAVPENQVAWPWRDLLQSKAVQWPQPPAAAGVGRKGKCVPRGSLTRWECRDTTRPPCQAQTPKQLASCYSLLGPSQHPLAPLTLVVVARGMNRPPQEVQGAGWG